MIKTSFTAIAFALIAGISHATPTTFDSATTDLEIGMQAETELSYSCAWVTLYDYWGNWVTVYECY